jgi:hypothetical protein
MIAERSEQIRSLPERGRRRGFAKHCFAPPQPAGCAKPAVGGWEGRAFNLPFACFIFYVWYSVP